MTQDNLNIDDFDPSVELQNMKRFNSWVQTIVPFVYDNSLSYYEVLDKMAQYLNEMATRQNQLSGLYNALVEYVNTSKDEQVDFINAFVEKVTTEFNNFVTEMESKFDTFTEEMKAEYEAFKTEINTTISEFETKITEQQTAFETKITEQQTNFESTINTSFEELKTEMETFKTDLNTAQTEFETSINTAWEEYKTNLTSEWTETKEYIDNYFANLDTTEIMKTAITEMLNDGSLETYFDGIFPALIKLDSMESEPIEITYGYYWNSTDSKLYKYNETDSVWEEISLSDHCLYWYNDELYTGKELKELNTTTTLITSTEYVNNYTSIKNFYDSQYIVINQSVTNNILTSLVIPTIPPYDSDNFNYITINNVDSIYIEAYVFKNDGSFYKPELLGIFCTSYISDETTMSTQTIRKFLLPTSTNGSYHYFDYEDENNILLYDSDEDGERSNLVDGVRFILSSTDNKIIYYGNSLYTYTLDITKKTISYTKDEISHQYAGKYIGKITNDNFYVYDFFTQELKYTIPFNASSYDLSPNYVTLTVIGNNIAFSTYSMSGHSVYYKINLENYDISEITDTLLQNALLNYTSLYQYCLNWKKEFPINVAYYYYSTDKKMILFYTDENNIIVSQYLSNLTNFDFIRTTSNYDRINNIVVNSDNSYFYYMIINTILKKMESLSYLTSSDLSNYVTNEALTTELGNYVTTDSLASAGYATTDYVDEKVANIGSGEDLNIIRVLSLSGEPNSSVSGENSYYWASSEGILYLYNTETSAYEDITDTLNLSNVILLYRTSEGMDSYWIDTANDNLIYRVTNNLGEYEDVLTSISNLETSLSTTNESVATNTSDISTIESNLASNYLTATKISNLYQEKIARIKHQLYYTNLVSGTINYSQVSSGNIGVVSEVSSSSPWNYDNDCIGIGLMIYDNSTDKNLMYSVTSPEFTLYDTDGNLNLHIFWSNTPSSDYLAMDGSGTLYCDYCRSSDYNYYIQVVAIYSQNLIVLTNS